MAPSRWGIPALVLALALAAGCGGPGVELVRLPERDAELYPYSESRQGVTVAVDPIAQAERSRRYFGGDLRKGGILPLNVVVSNHGEHRIRARPSDILVHRGGQVVDPLPVRTVAEYLSQTGVDGGEGPGELRSYLNGLHFARTVIPPGDTYQGVLFLSLGQPRRDRYEGLRILELFSGHGLHARVHLTDLEIQERLAFGPFQIFP